MTEQVEPTQKFVLREPVELVDIIYNDMGEPPEYLFKRFDGSEHEVIGCGGDYVKQVFVPLDKETLQQQLETVFESYLSVAFYEAVQHDLSEKDWGRNMVEHSAKVLATDAVALVYPESTK